MKRSVMAGGGFKFLLCGKYTALIFTIAEAAILKF
jgi:hypothetical protein